MYKFILIFFFFFISQNIFAKKNDFEVVSKPIEFKIFGYIFNDKSSVDDFLNNENIFISSNTLKNLGLIKNESGYQVIRGGKYYTTFLSNSETKNQFGYNFFILFLLIIICLLVLASFYFVFRFKWKKLDENKLVTFPEEAVNTMYALQNANKIFIGEIGEYLRESQIDQNTKINIISEQLNAFRELAEQRGSELKRYKEGYDYSNLKSLVLSIIDNIQNINKYLLNPEIINSPLARYLEATKDKLSITLQAKGVEEYIPEIGKFITDVDGCRATSTKKTEDENKINVICNVNKSGFKIIIDEKNIQIIKEAEVTVYSKGEAND